MKSHFLLLCVLFFCSALHESVHSAPIDLQALETKLKTEGLEGRVHAANLTAGLFVFTWRKPGDFFSHTEFPLVAATPALRDELRKLNRHDKIWVKGEFIANEAPQKHISFTELKVLEKYKPEWEKDYGAAFPEELNDKTKITAIVHAIANEGRIMVIEYKDSIIPVFVERPELTKDLYRNDKIELQFKVRKSPPKPRHLELDLDKELPVKVIDQIVSHHGEKANLEGSLVRFPASPQVIFDVFAIEVVDKDGTKKNYTLVNFDDDDGKIFKRIREKLGEIWKKGESEGTYARNKWVNHKIKVRAEGILNIVDAGQANPQILLTGPESLEFFQLVSEWTKL